MKINNLKHFLLITSVIMGSNSLKAQKLPSAREIMNRHYQLVYSKVFLDTNIRISNRLIVLEMIGSTETEDNTNNIYTQHLSFTDYDNKIMTTIQYNPYTDGTIGITRTFTSSNGILTSIDDEGKVMEIPIPFNIDNIDKRMQPIETKDYVVSKEKDTTGVEYYIIKTSSKSTILGKEHKYNVYQFFDVKTGLQKGTRVDDIELDEKNPTKENITSMRLTSYENFKTEDNMESHNEDHIFTTAALNTSDETYNATYYNIDSKDFQENCYKNPKECYSKYFKVQDEFRTIRITNKEFSQGLSKQLGINPKWAEQEIRKEERRKEKEELKKQQLIKKLNK